MKTRSFILTAILFLTTIFPHVVFGQNIVSWSANLEADAGFIENRGQFSRSSDGLDASEIQYGFDQINEDYLFTSSGVSIVLTQYSFRQKSEEEIARRAERKTQPFTLKEWQEFEREGERVVEQADILHAQWINANPNPEIIPSEKNSFTHTYTFRQANGQVSAQNNIPSYRQLTYRNVYPNIDVLYELHPDGGLKYSLIVRPGGDVSQIQLKYSKNPAITGNGNLQTPTAFGNITDHAPITFYEGGQPLQSAYKVAGNVISFQVAPYDQNRTIIIDPWTQTPAFPTNWDCIWECETDAAGNSYIIGGVMPLELHKYNAAGTLQWAYNTPYDTTSWLGVFATDDAGNSYVTQGSTAEILCVNTAGVLQWHNTSPGGLFSSTEFWNIAFNCDQTKLVVGGTGGVIPPLPYMYDINPSNGNVISSLQVTGSALGIPPNTQEVRAVVATNNEKYYFLTHDSIGYVSDNLTLCPGNNGTPFHVENGGYNLSYKNEDWRYNNTGVEAMAFYNDFVFVNRGNRLDKREFATANIVASVAIPGGGFTSTLGQNQVENSGIAIDACGTIYVGSKNGVYVFDQNLNQTGSFATSFKVYDVEVTSTGEVIAAGSTGDSNSSSRSGSVQSFGAGACAQLATVCCNPSVCDPGLICDSNAPFALQAETPGGTWSISPATSAFNASTGTFAPSASGAGTWTVTYTLACGSESIDVTVNTCTALSVCVETNGDLTVTGGTGPYNWEYFEPGGTTPITNQTECQNCGYTWTFGTCLNGFIPVTSCNTPAGYVNFATGVTVTPPVSNDIQVTDANGTVLQFDPATLPACSASCDPTITPQAAICANASPVSFSAVDPGGTWSATCGTCIGSSTGTFVPSTAGPGTYTITYSLPCGSTDTETITVNPLDDAAFTYPSSSYCPTDPNPSPTISGLSGGSFTINNGGTINSSTGVIDLAATGTGSFTVTYSTSGSCPNSATFAISITSGADATITPAGPFCESDPSTTLFAADPGGTWSATCGTCIDASGNFDPAVAGAGSHTITYTISGGCGDTDTETIVVNASDDAGFSYASASFCLTDPDPLPSISGLSGGTFTIDNGGAINAANGTIDIAASGAGNYVVTYTTNGPCPSSQTFSLTLTSGADATITPAGPFCANDASVNLSAADPGGTWTATCGACINASGNFDPSIAGAGTHTITYTISGGCGDTDTETIVVNAADDASFNYAAGAFCTTDPDPTASIIGTSGGTFSIDNGGTINSANGTIDLDVTGTGSYTITYTTSGPCPDSQTFNITISNAFDATISPAGPFCENDPVTALTAANPGGAWTASCVSCINASGNFNPALAGAGTHTVTYTIPGSCGDTDTETIVVNPSDNAAFSFGASTYCSDETDPSPAVTGTTGGTFTISGGGTINPTSGQIDLDASGPGTFTVTYTTSGSCPDAQTQTITITDPASVSITAAGPFCENDPVINLTASVPGGVWSGPGITNPSTGTFDPTLAGAGTWEVFYTIAGNCGGSDSIDIVVLPVPSVYAGADTTVDEGGTISLNGTSSPGAVIWSGPDGFVAITLNPEITPADISNAGTYILTVTGSNGCSASDTVTVFVNDVDEAFWVPNIFSPNGDGNNDFFFVRGDGLNGFNLKIFNRWGEMIFESVNQQTPWDGRQNGKAVDSGVYVYLITYTNQNGEEQVVSGNVTVVQY